MYTNMRMVTKRLLAKGSNSVNGYVVVVGLISYSYHVPKNIQEHLDYITPGIRLLAPEKRQKRWLSKVTSSGAIFNSSNTRKIVNDLDRDVNDLSKCNEVVTPACIRALYQVPEIPEYPNGQPRADNSLGIFEEGDFYVQEDLDNFFKKYAKNIPAGNSPIAAFIDGAYAPNPPGYAGGESNLDLTLAMPLIYPQTTT